MLWESSFLATFGLMLHIKNRGQPIRAARPAGKTAMTQESATQCLTKRVNVGLRTAPIEAAMGQAAERPEETEN
jgi:hypothetical protein